MDADPRSFLLLVTGPSGAGKSSILRPVLEQDSRLDFSVSCTTRPMRPGEQDGREYHFIDREKFEELIDQGAFVEWAHVHEHLYGTRHQDLEEMMAQGKVPVLDVDIQGGLNILSHYGERVLSVFIFPPSWEILEKRLRGRGTDGEEMIQIRLNTARREVAQADRYEYYLVNEDLEMARESLKAILRAESHRRRRWPHPPLES